MKTTTTIDYMQAITVAIFIAFFKCPLWTYITIIVISKTIDIAFGVWKVNCLKEVFSWKRFFQGILGCALYLLMLLMANLIDKSIIQQPIYGNDMPIVKLWVIVVLALEYSSVEKKRKACGKVALLSLIRNAIKIIKELVLKSKEIIE